MAASSETKARAAYRNEPFALRSELWKLTRRPRIATPEELYGASVLAQTVEETYDAIINPCDCEKIVDLGLRIVRESNSLSHTP